MCLEACSYAEQCAENAHANAATPRTSAAEAAKEVVEGAVCGPLSPKAASGKGKASCPACKACGHRLPVHLHAVGENYCGQCAGSQQCSFDYKRRERARLEEQNPKTEG